MVTKLYNMIMDEDKNSLRALPKTVKLQLMTILAYMWCGVFSVGIGSFLFFGTSVVLHTLLIIGTIFTGTIFSYARNNKLSYLEDKKTHKDAMKDKKNGCAMYDDVWGGI